MTANDLPFDLSALSIFLAVCENGGMAPSALKRGITQPAISQVIGDIESRSGTLLFDRSVRPLALTATGAVLREQANLLIAEIRQIASQLRVGIVDSLSRADCRTFGLHGNTRRTAGGPYRAYGFPCGGAVHAPA